MPKSSAAIVEPINSYQQDGMSLAARRARQLAETRTSRGSTISAVKPKKSAKILPMGPTPERLAKGDIVKATGGSYVAESGLDRLRQSYGKPVDPEAMAKAESVLARLHHRVSLDHDPGMNERMYQAGRRYEELVHIAGLNGVKAQDLLAVRGNLNAESDGTARAILQLRKAWAILSRPTILVLHGLLVEGRSAEEVGREVSSFQGSGSCKAAATTALRIALWTLVEARWA